MPPPIDSYQELRRLGLDRVIAEAYADEIAARTLLQRISYPNARIQNFTNATNFWTGTFIDIQNGVIVGGYEPLLRQAAEDHPHNPALKPWSRQPQTLEARAQIVDRSDEVMPDSPIPIKEPVSRRRGN